MTKRVISKKVKSIFGFFISVFFALSTPLYALDKGTCYSVQLVSFNKLLDTSIPSKYPNNCEVFNFTKTSAVRCGCYNKKPRAYEELIKARKKYKNATIAQTYKRRFELNVNKISAAKTTAIVVPAPILDVSPVVLSSVSPTSASTSTKNEETATSKSEAVDNTETKDNSLVEESSTAEVLPKTSVSPIPTASLTEETSVSPTATASFTKETSASPTTTVSFIEDEDLGGFTDDDLSGFSEYNTEENDLDGFSDDEEDTDLDGFSEEDEGLDGFSDDDELSGFLDDEEVSSSVIGPFTDNRPSALENLIGESSLTGGFAFNTTYGLENHAVEGVQYSGINQAQTAVYLQFDKRLSKDWKFRISGDAYYDAIYKIRDQDYSEAVLDAYETQLRLDDTYLLGSITENLDLKLGRQIVLWGKSDNIRITDIINPTDNRLPGVTDIKYIRLPVGMAKFDYYIDNWNISALIIGETRFNITAPSGSEFLPIDANDFIVPDDLNTTPVPPTTTPTTPATQPGVETPKRSLKNIQYGLAANAVFSGWDLSFYAAYVFDKAAHSAEPLDANTTEIGDLVYNRIYMGGIAANMVSGAWLYKGEIAYLNGIGYYTTSDSKERVDALVGIEYYGLRDTSMSFEISNRHIFDFEEVMENEAQQDTVQTIIRVTRNFLHEKLEVTGVVNILGYKGQDGGFGRLWGEYELGQALSIEVGIVVYQGGDELYLESIKDNDRVYSSLRYAF